jgi:hypothetical protein
LTLDHGDELADDVRSSSLPYAAERLDRARSCRKQASTPQLGLWDPGRRSVAQHCAHLSLLDASEEGPLGQAADLGGLGDREAVHALTFAGRQADSCPASNRLAEHRVERSQLQAVTPSEERLSRNEAIFREINERTRSLQDRFGPDDPNSRYEEFLCECGDQLCVERVKLTVPEYESVRAESTQFVLRPGHTMPRVERIVVENDRYVVVTKVGDAAEVAADRDPRS